SKFGFGRRTGVDIKEERSGILPSREWKKAKRNEPWYVGDSISIGIGQGYWTTTPIQLVQSIAILATKGKRYQPHLLKATSDNGSLLTEKQHDALAPVKLNNEAYWSIANKSMYYAARMNPNFKNAPYRSAVKSGTAQIFSIAEDEEYDSKNVSEHLRDNALFVGWAPYKNPKIAVAVILENAGWGSINAAPVVRTLFDQYLSSTKAKL
ncbi:MAG: penicillin-binding protein 2, partial [Shewanellaceae bacterium]|nr:penicillin-binding protein 2 [Shewanellaceae bacterium]